MKPAEQLWNFWVFKAEFKVNFSIGISFFLSALSAWIGLFNAHKHALKSQSWQPIESGKFKVLNWAWESTALATLESSFSRSKTLIESLTHLMLWRKSFVLLRRKAALAFSGLCSCMAGTSAESKSLAKFFVRQWIHLQQMTCMRPFSGPVILSRKRFEPAMLWQAQAPLMSWVFKIMNRKFEFWHWNFQKKYIINGKKLETF